MYLRTFSASGKVMKGMLIASMLVFVALTILFITGTLLMSEGIAQSPIVAIKALRYHVQFRYLHYAWGVCDIAADLWICALPLLGLKVLKISCKRKMELCLKFCVPAVSSAQEAPALMGTVLLTVLTFSSRSPGSSACFGSLRSTW